MNGIVNNAQVDQLVKALDEVFAKLPALPANVREILVKIAPWLALIFGILGVVGSLFGILAMLGLGAFGAAMVPYGGLAVASASGLAIVVLLFSLVSSVMELLAYPGLKDRKMVGWKWAFLSLLVSVVGSVVGLSSASIVGAVVSFVIGFYLLSQIKSYYK